MRRSAWPLASMYLALSACNALTGASDLSTCPSCDDIPDLDSGVASDARLPEATMLDGSSADARDVTTTTDSGTDAKTDADANAAIGCQGAVACTRVVFVTSALYSGDLGGIAGADAKCQALADQSSIASIRARTFLAWVSTATSSTSTRMVHGTQPYVGANGATIASSWSDLTDGTLQNGISFDEVGGNRNGAGAWTGTSSNGSFTGSACASWTSASTLEKGDVGNVGGNGGGWSGNNGADACNASHSLYCFEK